MADSLPQIDYAQEVRFAVVMYGGVSLAIYINGIAQELFRLVSSTARDEAGSRTALPLNDLTGTERVYRKLSHIRSDREFRNICKAKLKTSEKKNGESSPDIPDRDDSEPIRTRFVVDILSGTSAGGINAIYLAKALANNQTIDQLKELWVNEGDIALLINDKGSVKDLGLRNQQPPQSLLNSRRMYLKLLSSLDGMEKVRSSKSGEKASGSEMKTPNPDTGSRFLDDLELDLFITATDIQGLALPIRLSDSVVYERCHRNRFHFRYASEGSTAEPRNDFVSENNPFLAFAARCTSSFPFAFEPMKLSDIDEVLDTLPKYRGHTEVRADAEKWRSFFDANIRATTCLTTRPFGDGGYLDNKPFSYAAKTIGLRHSLVPVDRKLIYIEPSPEHPEDENLENNQIDALQNVKAALFDLPTYETIREDLQDVLERNNLITRVNRITDEVEKDLDRSGLVRPTLREGEWQTLDLTGMTRRFGIYYVPYRRLRIEAASDELARTVAKTARLNENSAEYLAVRSLVHAWRELKYPDSRPDSKTDWPPLQQLAQQLARVTSRTPGREDQKVLKKIEGILKTWLQVNFSDKYGDMSALESTSTEPVQESESAKTANQFLCDYNLKYWLRRLAFVRSKIDQLVQLLRLSATQEDGFRPDEDSLQVKEKAIVDRLKRLPNHPLGYSDLNDSDKDIRDLLTFLKRGLNEVYQKFRVAGRDIRNPSGTKVNSLEPSFAEGINKIKFPTLVNYLLGVDAEGSNQAFSNLTEADCLRRARELLEDQSCAAKLGAPNISDDLNTALEALRKCIKEVGWPGWLRCRDLLEETQSGLPKAITDKFVTTRGSQLDKRTRNHFAGICEFLWRYLDKFDDYDQIRFPILYGTDVGESDVVDIFRISPQDATSLINEREESKKPNGRLKLAGTSLHHFGAFLDRVWRQNDIMWGRLDGAERLITALLPSPNDADLRAALIHEAHRAILVEELPEESRLQLSALMSEALVRASSGEPIEEAVNQVTQELTNESPIRTRLAKVIAAGITPEELLKLMKCYQVNRKPDPTSMLESISRSTQIIGRMFEGLANRNGFDGRSLSWIARLGQFFWGLVQVALPDSLWHKLATNWLYLLYIFEFVIIVAGIVLSRPGAQQFGWTALGITAIVNVLTLLLTDAMRGRTRVKWALIILLGGPFSILALIGALKLVGVLGFTVGSPALPPLAWLSQLLYGVLSKWYLRDLFVLLAVLFSILFLNQVGSLDLRWLAHFLRLLRRLVPKKTFKPIKLKSFRKKDVKNVRLCLNSNAQPSYIFSVRLSAEPPPNWIRLFEDHWRVNNPKTQARINRNTLRVVSDLTKPRKIWKTLKDTITATNEAYSQLLNDQNQIAFKREQTTRKAKEKEVEAMWNKLKRLH